MQSVLLPNTIGFSTKHNRVPFFVQTVAKPFTGKAYLTIYKRPGTGCCTRRPKKS